MLANLGWGGVLYGRVSSGPRNIGRDIRGVTSRVAHRADSKRGRDAVQDMKKGGERKASLLVLVCH